MLLLLFFFTFFSFFSCFFFGRLFNHLTASLFSTYNLQCALLVAIILFYDVCLCQSPIYLVLGQWFNIGFLTVDWSFIIDSLTSVMLLVILIVSVCTHIYSIEYMATDPHQIKFMSYLSLFTFFMLVLVCSYNYIILFIGWEGVGICSYLLVNFWNTRLSANKSAIMAVFVNKIGDIALLISFSLLYCVFLSFNYSTIFVCYEYVNINYLFFICIFFLIGAIGKSAQLGLHIWLPEAMEGPTPVSSLIHAATMVTAGIFLIIRSNLLFQYLNNLSLFIIGVGSMTAFLGATIGFFQWDIKKIIAYSTCSQLGYMFLACGLSNFTYSINHLAHHAFFKALLFLTAGYIIHSLSNEQDLRKFGSLFILLPFGYIAILIGSMSLSGFPFLSGFFSKEKIIESFLSFYITNNYYNIYLYHNLFIFKLMASLAVLFTIGYSIKILYYSFFYIYQNNYHSLLSFHYSSLLTLIPLLFLSVLSIVSGYLCEDMMVGVNTNFWNSSIFTLSSNNIYFYNFIYFEFAYNFNGLFFTKDYLALYNTCYFIILFFIFFSHTDEILFISWFNYYTYSLVTFFNKKYLFINKNIIHYFIDKSYFFAYNSMLKIFDKGIIEILGPYGITKIINSFVNKNNKLQTGFVYHYSGFIIISILIMLNIYILFN